MSTSIFEIVGPVMVGPSSSHTAGMARIGMMAHRIAGFVPSAITLRLSPVLRTTYRGHRTDAALVGGAVGMSEDDAGLKTALEDTVARGISIGVEFYPAGIYHPNTAQIEMISADGEQVFVRGVSVGGGSLYIEAVDEQEVHLEPDRYHILLRKEKGACLTEEALPAGIRASGGVLQQGETIAFISLAGRPAAGDVESLAKAAGIKDCRVIEPVLTYGATVSEEMRFTTYEEIIEKCRAEGILLPDMAIAYEHSRSGLSAAHIKTLMEEQLAVMKESVRCGLEETNQLVYGLLDGKDAKRLKAVAEAGRSISGGIVPSAVAMALGVMEYNASMGCIVAAPTAGSAGIVPGCLLALQEAYGFNDMQIVKAMCVSALAGVVMAHRGVSFSGAVGGCQGEIGVSSAIAAAGIAALYSDDPQVPFEAMAMAMKNLLGLVCDPIAGPVEVPCIKRNSVGVANAFAAAEMACAGITSYISPDQVIDALIDVEHRLPCELRATTTGGLACTKRAVALREALAKADVK